VADHYSTIKILLQLPLFQGVQGQLPPRLWGARWELNYLPKLFGIISLFQTIINIFWLISSNEVLSCNGLKSWYQTIKVISKLLHFPAINCFKPWKRSISHGFQAMNMVSKPWKCAIHGMRSGIT
jgi:hypothetical protein